MNGCSMSSFEMRRGGRIGSFLLAPVAVTLSKEEYAVVLQNLELLRQAGFEAEDFGAGTVLVRAAR